MNKKGIGSGMVSLLICLPFLFAENSSGGETDNTGPPALNSTASVEQFLPTDQSADASLSLASPAADATLSPADQEADTLTMPPDPEARSAGTTEAGVTAGNGAVPPPPENKEGQAAFPQQ